MFPAPSLLPHTSYATVSFQNAALQFAPIPTLLALRPRRHSTPVPEQHAICLAFNYLATSFLPIPLAMNKSVVIMASEMSLPVALAILTQLPPDVGTHGLITIPMIFADLTQVANEGACEGLGARNAKTLAANPMHLASALTCD